MPMHHAPCTKHHAPCTSHHAPCTMHFAPSTYSLSFLSTYNDLNNIYVASAVCVVNQ